VALSFLVAVASSKSKVCQEVISSAVLPTDGCVMKYGTATTLPIQKSKNECWLQKGGRNAHHVYFCLESSKPSALVRFRRTTGGMCKPFLIG